MRVGKARGSIGRTAIAMWVVYAAALPTLFIGETASYAQNATRLINGIDVSGRFLEEWGRQGSDQNSVYVNGLPITPRRPEISTDDGKLYETQWFERARYEWHPANVKPYDVLLGRLGASYVEGRCSLDPVTKRIRNPLDVPFMGITRPNDGDVRAWFSETQHSTTGKIKWYWERYGGVKQFGFPLSEPFFETSRADGKLYEVQYFERARMELHPEKAPPYEVELGLLGAEQYRQTPISAESLPIAPPQGVTSAKSTVKIAVAQEPSNLTQFDNSHVSSRMRALLEDSLTARDADERVFPVLAWYVPTLENGGARFIGIGDDRFLQVKYKIRQGIKWSDGREVTSNDAIFHYRLMMHPDTPALPSAYNMLESVVNPDNYTVIYNFRSLKQVIAFLNSLPNPQDYSFLQAFVIVQKPPVSTTYSEIGAIYPEHVLAGIPPGRITASQFARAPVGAGPYKVVKWTAGQEMIFEQNEHYNLTAKPLIKRIEVKFFTDRDGSFTGLKGGEVDIITEEAFHAPPNAALTQQFSSIGMDVRSRTAASWEHIDFYFGYEPFKDRRVREAIISAVNRSRIISQVYRGTAAATNGAMPPFVSYSIENPSFSRTYPDVAAKYKLPIYPYDPDKAARLLDAAGWRCPPNNSVKTCAGGVREKAGVKLQFEYATTILSTRQQIQSLVQADLRAVGIDAQTKAYPSNVFFSSPGPRSDGTAKLAQFTWAGSSDSDFSSWLCVNKYDPGKNRGQNEQQYCNPKIDEANRRYITDLDPQVQAPAIAEAQVTLMQDIALIPLAQRPNIEVVSAKLINHKLTNSQITSFWNARQWYFR